MSDHLQAIGINKKYETLMRPCEITGSDNFALFQEHGRVGEPHGGVRERALARLRRGGVRSRKLFVRRLFLGDFSVKRVDPRAGGFNRLPFRIDAADANAGVMMMTAARTAISP